MIEMNNMGYKFLTDCEIIVVPESEIESIKKSMLLGDYDESEIEENFEKCLIEHLNYEVSYRKSATCICLVNDKYYLFQNRDYIKQEHIFA